MEERWTSWGIYFGYPQCCIANFVVLDDIKNRSDEQKQVHKGTGFIPCHSCTKKIVEGEVTLEGLIKNRICPTEFPNEN